MIKEEKKLKLQQANKEKLNRKLINACYDGDLDIVKYLLTSPELKEHANIHAQNDDAFIWSCSKGHLDIVKYLLSSPDLTEHANIHAQNDNVLIEAFYYGNLDIVKYLLTSPDLKEHVNIHIDNDQSFKYACHYDRDDVIEYLIFDYKIEYTRCIKEYLTEINKKSIINMFNTREFEKKLHLDLPKDDRIKTLTKIKL